MTVARLECLRLAASIGALATCVACGGSSDANGSHGIRNGARLATFTIDLHVGGADSGAYDLNSPWDLAVDAQQRIYVSLPRAGEVRVFSSDGKFVRTLGRPGSGPGEFRFPTRVVFDHRDRLWVTDVIRKAYVVFDSNGTLAAEYRFPAAHACRAVLCGVFLDDDTHLDGEFRMIRPNVSETRLFEVDTSGGRREIMTFPAPGPAGAGDPRIKPFPKRRLFAVDGKGNVWTGFNDDAGLVAISLAGDTVARIRTGFEPQPITSADKLAFKSLVSALGGLGNADISTFPRLKPRIAHLAIAADGSVWIAPVGKTDGETQDFGVFNPDGSPRYHARLTEPVAIPSSAGPSVAPTRVLIIGKTLYAFQQNADGFTRLARATMKE